MATVTPTLVRLSRGYVAVTGPDAAEFLERMVSNEVASLEPGEARRALLLTPKGRIVAPLRAVREGPESFLLITEAELAETLASTLATRSLRGQVRDRGQALPRLPQARRGRRDPQRRLRRRGLRELGRGRARGCSRRGARAAAHRRGHSGLGQRAGREHPSRRGGARRDAHLVHQGLLPGPGADRAPALPRPPEPAAAGARGRGREPGRRDRSRAGRSSAASPAPFPAVPLATCDARCPTTPSSR